MKRKIKVRITHQVTHTKRPVLQTDSNTPEANFRTLSELLDFAIFNLRANLVRRNKRWKRKKIDAAVAAWLLKPSDRKLGTQLGRIFRYRKWEQD